jgi:hypothetical protein
MRSDAERERLRETFDQAADIYHRVRPDSPEALFDDLIVLAGLALWAQEHVFPDGGDPFFEEIQDVYEEIGEGLPPDAVRFRPGELEDDRAGIEASGLFDVTGVRQYDWERVYRAEEYIELLNTFSGHLTMADWQRGACTGRSAGGWRGGRTGRCGGDGGRCCT